MSSSQWTRNRPKQAYKFALLGANEQEIADLMEISKTTLEYWKRTKPMFLKWLKRGKDSADARAVKSLFRRAVGYDYTETKTRQVQLRDPKTGQMVFVPEVTVTTKHIPGDVTAQKFWLSCRQRGRWTEVQEIRETRTNIQKIDLTGMTTEQLRVLKEAGLRSQLPQHSQN